MIGNREQFFLFVIIICAFSSLLTRNKQLNDVHSKI